VGAPYQNVAGGTRAEILGANCGLVQ